MLIPNSLIIDLIFDRQVLEQQVQSEISAGWGPDQKIVGPILSIPYRQRKIVDDKIIYSDHVLKVLPSELSVDVDVSTEERKKGIYKAILYKGGHSMSGVFTLPSNINFGNYVDSILWSEISIDIGFSASSSLEGIAYVDIGGIKHKMRSGASSTSSSPSSVHTTFAIDPSILRLDFSCAFSIKGSGSLTYVPVADSAEYTLRSDWHSPSFIGFPLPGERQISSEGFTAQWNNTEYNKPFKRMWEDDQVNIYRTSNMFGVKLVSPVGHYQKNMRSSKYALMIMSLTFMMFFFFEVLKGAAIHSIQYVFVGLALSVFYVLLLSLSEHVGFEWAYFVASCHIIGLIGWYSIYMFNDKRSVFVLISILVGLYGYIYILLQMEDYALVVGSLGLFAILASVMYLSRRMNWYEMHIE